MYGKAFAPEYQGALGSRLSVNSSYEEVLALAAEELRRAGTDLERARACLAAAEANRRLGRVEEAGRAWRDSYRRARAAEDPAAMAWALWSGGTLARQCGTLRLARRLLAASAELAARGGDRTARGYALAGLAETGRIQGDYAAVTELHERLLAEARAHGEARHTVWALEGIAQMNRNTGAYDTALAQFEEAARIAETAHDARGHAWALRGVADVLSVRGETGRALALLSRAAEICAELNLAGALAYNLKMRGNVLFRAERYAEAEEAYADAERRFHAMREPRGESLARLGLVKTRSRMGRCPELTRQNLDELHRTFDRIGLHHAREMVERFRAEVSNGEDAGGAEGVESVRSLPSGTVDGGVVDGPVAVG
ncbi:tetratricopeptide repeat protein [Streptomyces sp. NPDC050610]|uniref:tetratricopeptide repeat protein n=1 Tax=Streptomyces sp. NPDC050610 TaxID=3157097 RepID=UPI0034286134